MMLGLPICSSLQCKQNCHKGACLESFQANGHFKPSYIEAHQASKMICNLRSLESQIKTHSFLEEIITSSNEVLKNFESDMVVRSRKQGDPTQQPAESNDTVKSTEGS